MQVWEANADFKSLLAADPQIQPYLSAPELAELFDLGYHTRNVDAIFARVFPEGQPR
ncbi:adenylosuccinate lyase, partial [Acidithiobacillus ferrooxidans]|nr:adenylosuccinate lyase [Acidithiobacillus ferrooxidans]